MTDCPEGPAVPTSEIVRTITVSDDSFEGSPQKAEFALHADGTVSWVRSSFYRWENGLAVPEEEIRPAAVQVISTEP